MNSRTYFIFLIVEVCCLSFGHNRRHLKLTFEWNNKHSDTEGYIVNMIFKTQTKNQEGIEE